MPPNPTRTWPCVNPLCASWVCEDESTCSDCDSYQYPMTHGNATRTVESNVIELPVARKELRRPMGIFERFRIAWKVLTH